MSAVDQVGGGRASLKRPSARAIPSVASKATWVRPLALRLANELGPLLVFFVATRIWDIYVGTGAFIAATAAALALSVRREGRVPLVPLVSLALLVLFGGLTLAYQDDQFIVVRPTVMNAVFALGLLGGLLAGRLVVKEVLGDTLALRDRDWRRLTWRLIAFLLSLAVLNEIVWRNFSTDVWVDFKVFGILALNLLFLAAQYPLLVRARRA